MSIQDDIFDVEAALEGKPEAKAFDQLCAYIGELETEIDELKPKVHVIENFKALLTREGKTK